MMQSDSKILDVAIVGGGVSGIYSGWRLLSQAKDRFPSVALFEGDDRLGGRLLSVTPPGIDTHVELGGMRYTSSHTRVVNLVRNLGLTPDPFPVYEPQNIAYVRGKMLRRQDLTDATKIPYELAPDERSATTLGNGFTALAAQRLARIITGKDIPLNEINWRDLSKKEFGPEPKRSLNKLPIQYVIQRNISQEAFRFAEDTSGYDSILHTWNAADGLPWNLADFGSSPGFFHLREGYAALPLTLADLFAKAGGDIHMQQWLQSFKQAQLPDGSIGVELHFEKIAGPLFARHLILAMPRRSLELLRDTGGVFENEKNRLLVKSVTPIPLFKLAICYPYAWWETLDPVQVATNGTTHPAAITHGQSITDLPLRQCYYWAKNPQTQRSVVLIYDDGTDLDYWAGLRSRKYRTPFVNDLAPVSADFMESEWEKHKAPEIMVEEAHRQLCVMHGVRNRFDIPQPSAAAYRDWGEDPYGGGANFWNLDVDSYSVFNKILKPAADISVHVCGEAYSHDQGWVEGALATADAMLEQHFDLPQPQNSPASAPAYSPVEKGIANGDNAESHQYHRAGSRENP